MDYLNILRSLKGFFIINKEEEIVLMGDDLLDELGLTEQEAVGKKIAEIIPTTKIQRTLQTGEKQIGVMYFVEGFTVICNSYPIYQDGELVGAIEIDVFSNVPEIEEFLNNVNMLPNIQPKILKEINTNRKKYAKYSIDDIRGNGSINKKLKDDIIRASKSNSTLLVTGETGCGKELVAHSVHRLGQRGLFNFVRINCAAIPTELFESELFGYEAGSFTGASKEGKKGMVEMANNGTLFLDEVDSLPAHMQAKLLRFLQEKEIYRIGGEYAIEVNTRIIAATNHNLVELVKENKLRKDLYYRLNVLEIRVPSLRERLEDIPDIVAGIVDRLNVELDRSAYKITSIDKRIYPLLMAYEWPGNIRELGNIVERAMSLCYSHNLKLEHFQEVLKDMPQEALSSDLTVELKNQTVQSVKHEAEKKLLIYALHKSDWNIKDAANSIGISVQMLYRKMNLYNIKQ